jgi:peptidoglycan/xylan/chitin deacetylase (PgdA/CDA1 family)
MTRDDANELVSKLVARSRKESKELVKELEALLEQARKGVEKRTREAQRRTTKARRRVEKETTKAQRQVRAAAGKAARGVRDATEEPLARADAARRRAGVGPSFPITGYDELTAAQIGRRLGDLSKPELRKVRTHEKNGKGRKSILDKIDRALA